MFKQNRLMHELNKIFDAKSHAESRSWRVHTSLDKMRPMSVPVKGKGKKP